MRYRTLPYDLSFALISKYKYLSYIIAPQQLFLKNKMTQSNHEELKEMILLLHSQLQVYKKLEIEREKVKFEDELENRTETRLSERLASR